MDEVERDNQFNETWLNAAAQELFGDDRSTGWQMKVCEAIRQLYRDKSMVERELAAAKRDAEIGKAVQRAA